MKQVEPPVGFVISQGMHHPLLCSSSPTLNPSTTPPFSSPCPACFHTIIASLCQVDYDFPIIPNLVISVEHDPAANIDLLLTRKKSMMEMAHQKDAEANSQEMDLRSRTAEAELTMQRKIVKK
eukprot:scaffold11379_cov120-Cylindrotheca_fusiformis.AAC.2